MDTFGSVDPYALLHLEGVQYRTQTVKNSYSPEWNETFTCDMMDIDKGCISDFVVQVNDWDATSKDDEVGSFTIPASRMAEIVRAKIGWEGQETFTLYREGKSVTGHDKGLSEITVKVRVLEAPKAFATLEVDAEAKGPRRVEVTVVSARHLPKVDILTGKCDPYVVVSLPGFAEFKTEVIKKTYDPDWQQFFSFDVSDVLEECTSDLSLTVMDHDMATADDKVGSSLVPKFRMTDLFRGGNDWEADETFVLMDRGQPVRGHDGDIAVLTIHFRVYDIQRHVGVVITVLSASNLPCMDPLPHVTRPKTVPGISRTEKEMQEPATGNALQPGTDDPVSNAGSGENELLQPRNDETASMGETSARATSAVAECTPEACPEKEPAHRTHISATEQKDDASSTAPRDADAELKTSPLPKDDAMSVDAWMKRPSPYCVSKLGLKNTCTSVQKNMFECEWKDEDMTMEVLEKAPLVVRLCDNDNSGLHDPIGEVVFTWPQVASLIRGKDGYFQEKKCDLLQDGELVVGRDGNPAQIWLRLKVIDWTSDVSEKEFLKPQPENPQKRNRCVPRTDPVFDVLLNFR
jgi:hypothetical protein